MVISKEIEEKLRTKHQVTNKEVYECLANCKGNLLIDNREQHRTNPPTNWIIAETNRRRELKVCFMIIDGDIHIKSAFEPNEKEQKNLCSAWKKDHIEKNK
ncbi:ADP-ribosyl-(dinitrogen reductase) hydrolase [Enterobacter cloacae]|nr:ADP-ribosyl-(dinitrogen reductase) hydrolase [Enterobacter cloacae]